MKVNAKSFDVNMESLLDRMNHNSAKTYSGKIIQRTGKKLQKLQKDIDNTINTTEKEFNGKHSDLANLVNHNYKDVNQTMLKNYNDLTKKQKQNVINLTDLANGNHDDAVRQINQTWGIMKGTTITVGDQKIKINNASDILYASHLEGQKIADDMTQQIKAIRQGNQEMLNNQINPEIQKKFNEAINTIPATTTYYYPDDNTKWPDNPAHGDLCWKSDWDDANGNYVNAKLYEYYNGQGWIQKKTGDPSIYAANINGASLKGGMITGATYESAGHDISGHANFSVNADGRLYAHNLVTDLMHTVNQDQINPCVYYGFLNGGQTPDGNSVGVPPSGFSLTNGILSMKALVEQASGEYNWDYQNHMIGQSLLEPGYLKLRYSGDIGYVRSDLRAGMLEIAADTNNQDRGARLGYLDGPTGQSPATLWLDGWFINEAQTGSDNLWIRNQRNKGIIQLDAPTNVTGPLLVDNHIKINGKDVGGRLDKAEHRLSGHDTAISGHTDRLNRHRDHLNRHDTELSAHQTWMYKHDDLFDQRGRKLDSFTQDLKNKGDILTKHGKLIGENGDRITDQNYTLDSHGNILTQHGHRLSNHDQQFIEKQSQLDDHKGRLDAHDTSLKEHQNEIDQINTNTNNISTQMSSWSSFIDQINSWKAGGGIQISGLNFYENRIYGNSSSQQVLFHNYYNQPIDIRAGAIYSHGKQLTDDSGNLVQQNSANIPSDIATQSWVSQNFKSVLENDTPFDMATKSWVNSQGFAHSGDPIGGGGSTGNFVFNGRNVYTTGGYTDPGAIFVQSSPWTWCGVWAGDFTNKSDLSSKNNINEVDSKNALTQIINTDIKSYKYKGQNQRHNTSVGPIVDNLHDHNNQKYYTPDGLINHSDKGHGVSMKKTVSYLILSVQELQKQNSQLSQRIARLEFENNK